MIGATLSPASAALAGESAAASTPCVPADQTCVIVNLVSAGGAILKTYPPLSASDIGSLGRIGQGSAADYAVNGPSGPQNPIQVAEGMALGQLLSLRGGFNVAAVQKVQIIGNGVGAPTSTLTSSDLDPNTGIMPVVFTLGGTQTLSYAQLPRTPGEVNIQWDGITANTSLGPFVIDVTAPTATPVAVTDSIKSPKPGDTVAFTAHVPAGVGNQQISWDFPDGSSLPASSATTVTHQFSKAVSGDVNANLSGDGGANGVGTLKIVVKTATPPKKGTKPGTGKNTNPKAPATGPNSSNGNRVGAKASSQPGQGLAITNGNTSAGGQQQSQVNADAFSNLPLVTGRLISGAATVASLNATGAQQTATAPGAHVPAKWRLPLTVLVYALAVLLLFGGAYSELRVYIRRTKA